MRIEHLEVVNLRGFERAEFDFHRGMSLLVGDNGAGKTVVLDALRALLSQVLPQISASRARPFPFGEEDIRWGADFMTLHCAFEFQGREFTRFVRKDRAGTPPADAGRPHEEAAGAPGNVYLQPPLSVSLKNARKAEQQPLGIFFSTRRSTVSDASLSKGRIAGDQGAAFAGALAHRDFRLREIACRWGALEVQGAASPLAAKRLSILRETVERFLPGCCNLRADISPTPRLVADKGGKALDLRELSAGELGVLALVLDLALRLALANPRVADPARDGSAVVLIDELELHLHPKWQRTIVRELAETFPNCQFIATTHSPQIVAAVKPEQVLLLKGGEAVRPGRTLGMDSNWLLHTLMEADERSPEATAAIAEIEALMEEWDLETARLRIGERRREGFDLPYWSVLEARMARMEDLFERDP